MPSADLYTIEQAEDDIARLRGQVDKLTEVTGSGTPIMVNGSHIAIDPVNGGPETWHSLGTLAGYTVQVGRYRLTTGNEVEIDVEVTAGGSNANSVVFASTMPAAYRPLADRHPPLSLTGSVSSLTNQWPRLTVGANGAVTVLAPGSAVTICGATVRIPLD
jgi:hypothetical protein